MTKNIFSIAIDGPSGAGKSTIAKALAARFGLIYVDTGAIYRCVGLYTQRCGVDATDAVAVGALLPEIAIKMAYDSQGVQRMILNGEDVTGLIRTQEISRRASDASAHPVVREFLLDLQRSMARENSVIMDGRDIGTVVLPDADLKVFLTASLEARARRRYLELVARGEQTEPERVRREMEQRDYNDTNRAVAPLRRADDAVAVDTTELTLPESIEAIATLAQDKLGLVPVDKA